MAEHTLTYKPKKSALTKQWNGKGKKPDFKCLLPGCKAEGTRLMLTRPTKGLCFCERHYEFMRYTIGLSHAIPVEEDDTAFGGGGATMSEDYPR